MNAHQRRKYIKPLKPLVKQAIATYKLVDMPLRAAHLQRLVDEGEWLEAIEISQAVVRGDLPHDDISTLQARRSSGKSWFIEQQFEAYRLLAGKEISAFPLQASDVVDSALYAYTSGVRLQRSGDGQDVCADQGIRETLGGIGPHTQGSGPGTKVAAALDVAQRLQKVRP